MKQAQPPPQGRIDAARPCCRSPSPFLRPLAAAISERTNMGRFGRHRPRFEQSPKTTPSGSSISWRDSPRWKDFCGIPSAATGRGFTMRKTAFPAPIREQSRFMRRISARLPRIVWMRGLDINRGSGDGQLEFNSRWLHCGGPVVALGLNLSSSCLPNQSNPSGVGGDSQSNRVNHPTHFPVPRADRGTAFVAPNA